VRLTPTGTGNEAPLGGKGKRCVNQGFRVTVITSLANGGQGT